MNDNCDPWKTDPAADCEPEHRERWLGLALYILVASALPPAARAGESFQLGEHLSVTPGGTLAVAGFSAAGANFGNGRQDLRNGDNTGDGGWGEGYLAPSVTLESTQLPAGVLYGGVSAVAALTAGEGDPGGYTAGGDGGADLENAFMGWRSAALTAGGEDNTVDLSYGRQPFRVGDGFLIDDGNFENGNKGAYWLIPRMAYQRAGIARFDLGQWQGAGFYLDSDIDQDDTRLAGISLEYEPAEIGTFGLLYFRVTHSGPMNWNNARDGMDVFSARINGLTLGSLPGLSLWSEYVVEFGDGRDGRFNADAGYLEARYTFADLPWSPSLSYRYAYFSGDSDPLDTTRKDFEPFFYYGDFENRGWGTWNQGEVASNYLLFNSNQRNHMVHLSATPSAAITSGVLYFRFDLDQAQYYGTPVSSRRFADEINVYLDWSFTETVSASAVYGVALPAQGARDAFGDNQAFHIVEFAMYLSF